jgi:hypothetical protein
MASKGKNRLPGERKAFWLTYVPPTGDFENYEEAVRRSREGLPYDDTWQVENNVIRSEERVFILRQGNDQVDGRPARGIVARGITTSDSYEGAFHRDGTGRKTFRVSIRLDSVIAYDETPVKDPYYPITGKSYQGPQVSGFPIDHNLLKSIEAQWAARFDARVRSPELLAAAVAERERVMRSILDRRGQAQFRDALIEAYKCRCALTDCTTEEALEAAHIIPCSANGEDCVQNGLLLRADLHTLFDLDLFWIDPDTRKVKLAPQLAGGYYKWLEGKPLGENHVSVNLRARTNELRWRLANRAAPAKDETP